MKRNLPKYSDIRGSLDRGPRVEESHIVEKIGDVVHVMSTDIISTRHTTSIKEAARLMDENDVRRLPITNAGTGRLEGIVAAIDILDFLGGGIKFNIIEEDYKGNFLSAVNCPVHKIMESIQYLEKTADVNDAVKIMVEKHTSCIPVVDDRENLKVLGLVTERDILPAEGEFGVTVGEAMVKDVYTSSKGMMISDVAKVMVRNRVRRLPVILEEKLVGVVTVFDLLRYLAKGQYKGVNAEENLSTRVEEVMEHNVTSLKPDTDLGDVVSLVNETGLGGFPVVSNGRLEGIVTITDILRIAYKN